jgi:outer membrane lipoprotein SlyB
MSYGFGQLEEDVPFSTLQEVIRINKATMADLNASISIYKMEIKEHQNMSIGLLVGALLGTWGGSYITSKKTFLVLSTGIGAAIGGMLGTRLLP